MKIVTTTLNPAFDMHYEMKEFILFKENYVDSILISAGGKGINISRALTNSGIKNTAYVILGKENAENFVTKLNADGVIFKGVFCEGRIRENITVHTPGNPETRISLDSFSLTAEVLNQLLGELLQVVDHQTILTFSGRIPKGLPVDTVIDFLGELSIHRCLIAVDCNSFTMEELIRIRPWLIKPNEQEVKVLLGENVGSIGQAMDAAVRIHECGVENVIVSMGKAGAAAAAGDSKYIVEVPPVTPLSTIGAGDSMLAGFIGAYASGALLEECLKNAAVFGTSACLTQGTNPPKACDISTIREQIKVVKI